MKDQDQASKQIAELQAECASLKQIAELNAQIAIDLKAERDQLQAENERLKERTQTLLDDCNTWAQELKNEQRLSFRAERDALQSKLDAMGKGEPVATVQQYGEGVEAHLHSFLPIGTKLYAAPKALAPEQVEAAWRAGWAACRDAEYVGQEAEDEAWGMSETCANADWENAAPKALAPEPLTPLSSYTVDLDKVRRDEKDRSHGIGGTP